MHQSPTKNQYQVGFLICILMLFSLNAYAERAWTYFGHNEANDKIYIDYNSLVNMGDDLVFAELFVTYSKPLAGVRSELTFREFDCRNKLVRVNEAYFYSGISESFDDMVGFYNDMIFQWDLAEDKSIWRELLDTVCKKII